MSDNEVQCVEFSLQYCSIVILYYDYILTFQDEVNYIWCQRFRISTLLYILCRYALIANVVYLFAAADKLSVRVHFSPLHHENSFIGVHCDAGYIVSGTLSVLGRMGILIVWGMRTYAVYDRNQSVALVLGVMAIATTCTDIVHVPGLRCVGKVDLPAAPGVLAILMCIFEVTSATLTIVRIIRAMKAIGPWRLQKASLNYLLFEDGVLYIVCVTTLSVSALVLNYRGKGFIHRLLNGLTLPISGLLTARFLLHVRRWDYKRTRASHFSLPVIDIGRGTEVVLHDISFVDEFGKDPMRAMRRNARDERDDTIIDIHAESPVTTAFDRSPTLRIRPKAQSPTFLSAGPSSRRF